VTSLMCSEPNFALVSKNSRILQELMALQPPQSSQLQSSSYITILKQSFDTQLKNFRSSIDKIVVKYVEDVEATLGRFGDDDVGGRSTASTGPRRTSNPALKATGLIRFNIAGDSGGGQDDEMQSVKSGRSVSRAKSSNLLVAGDREQNSGYELLEEALFGTSGKAGGAESDRNFNYLDDDGFNVVGSSPGYRLGSASGGASDGYSDDGSDTNDTGNFGDSYGHDSSAGVGQHNLQQRQQQQQLLIEARVSFIEQLIDCIDTWLPTLHRLVTDLTKLSSSAAAAAVAGQSSGGSSANTRSSMIIQQRDSGLSPARRFCEQLTHCCDCIREAVSGVVVSQKQSAAQSGGTRLDGSVGGKVTGMQLIVTSDRLDLPIFTSMLAEPYYASVLRSIAELYDAVSTVIQTNRQTAASASAENASASTSNMSIAVSTQQPFGGNLMQMRANAISINSLQREMEQQIRYFTAAISDLNEFAKEVRLSCSSCSKD
jgi:hypothetical protein